MSADEKDDKSSLAEGEYCHLTRKIIGCGFTISNVLGCGFLERVFENSLAHELRKNGMRVEQQVRTPVLYDGVVVGDYVADLLVESTVLVEVKACQGIDEIHVAQCLNYLKATGLPVCLLMNFGRPRLEVRRLVRSERSEKRVQTGPELIREMMTGI